MRYSTTWILIFSIFVAESHSCLGSKGSVEYNWGWTVNWTMEMQWYVKYLSEEVNSILYFTAMFLYAPNKINQTTVLSFIILCFADLFMWIHNFKTLSYGSVYVWLIVVWGLLFYRGLIRAKIISLWKKIKTRGR